MTFLAGRGSQDLIGIYDCMHLSFTGATICTYCIARMFSTYEISYLLCRYVVYLTVCTRQTTVLHQPVQQVGSLRSKLVSRSTYVSIPWVQLVGPYRYLQDLRKFLKYLLTNQAESTQWYCTVHYVQCRLTDSLLKILTAQAFEQHD